MLLRNKRKQRFPRKKEAREKNSNNIAGYFIHLKTKGAAWIQQKTERLSGKTKMLVLILFCTLVGGYNIYIGTSGFSRMQVLSFSVGSIEQPDYIRAFGAEETINSFSISKEEYQWIRRFKVMDSMARSPSGKWIFDSIDPEVLDSILIIENRYQSQTKK